MAALPVFILHTSISGQSLTANPLQAAILRGAKDAGVLKSGAIVAITFKGGNIGTRIHPYLAARI